MDLALFGGQIHFISGHHDRYVLIIGPLLPNLFEAPFQRIKRFQRQRRIHQEESVSGGYTQTSHSRKLKITACVEYVNL